MSTQWVNTQPDAGALHALLLSLPDRIPIPDIDQIWIFPTRKIAVGESTVIVLSLFDADPERRRVMTARFTVVRDKKGAAKVQDKLDEYGTATLDAVSRVVEGVVRRLGEEIELPPRNECVDGNAGQWQNLMIDLGAPRSTFDPSVEGTPEDTPEEQPGAAAAAPADGSP